MSFYQAARAKIVLISFATVKKPAFVDAVVKARRKSLQSLQAEIVSQYAPLPGHSTSAGKAVAAQSKIFLVLVDWNGASCSRREQKSWC